MAKLPQVSGRYNLSVPNHRRLKKGTLRSLIRKADLTIAEFIQLLS